MGERLDSEIVYHNVTWSKSWWGLSLLHLSVMTVPAVVYMFAACWFDDMLPKSFMIPVFLASVVVVVGLNFRQPEGWLDRWLDNVGTPRFLSNHRVTEHPPFPVPREDLLCSKR